MPGEKKNALTSATVGLMEGSRKLDFETEKRTGVPFEMRRLENTFIYSILESNVQPIAPKTRISGLSNTFFQETHSRAAVSFYEISSFTVKHVVSDEG